MPVFIHHHKVKPSVLICPSCAVVPMHIKVVAPHWTTVKVPTTYECADCGVDITELLDTPELLH